MPSRKSRVFWCSDTEQRGFEGGNNNLENGLFFQEDIQKILEAEGIDLELCRKEKGHKEELPVENQEI